MSPGNRPRNGESRSAEPARPPCDRENAGGGAPPADPGGAPCAGVLIGGGTGASGPTGPNGLGARRTAGVSTGASS